MFDARSASMARQEGRAAVEVLDMLYRGYCVVYEIEDA